MLQLAKETENWLKFLANNVSNPELSLILKSQTSFHAVF